MCSLAYITPNVKLMDVEGQGRDPFPYVVNTASLLNTSEEWLILPDDRWQIGDNVEFPSSLLFIRHVNRKMVDFIIKHFEEAQDLVTIPDTSQSPS
jgi:hypothetical protein